MNNTLLLEENFEIESRMIESNFKSAMTFNDLTEAEKEEIFGSVNLENALEMCR